jgi:hypothetical protein
MIYSTIQFTCTDLLFSKKLSFFAVHSSARHPDGETFGDFVVPGPSARLERIPLWLAVAIYPNKGRRTCFAFNSATACYMFSHIGGEVHMFLMP